MTADFAKQFQVMSLVLTPPVIDGVIAVNVTRPLFCVTVIDPNDAPPYTYQWTQGGGAPPGALFETPTEACTYFGPLTLDTNYPVTLTVTNANGDSEELSFRVVSTNDLPGVYAGPDATLTDPPDTYTMSEASASDPRGRSLTYLWEAVSYPSTVPGISSATALNPVITFHSVDGVYVFQLTVSNGFYTTSSRVTLTVTTPAFSFLGSFVGIDNASGTTYSGPAMYYGLGQLVLRAGESAMIVLTDDYMPGVTFFYVDTASPGSLHSFTTGPYVGPGTWNFYSVIADNWLNTGSNPNMTITVDAAVTTTASIIVAAESQGTTPNTNLQSGSLSNFPFTAGSLALTFDFGAYGTIVVQDGGSGSFAIASNTTAFTYTVTTTTLNYTTGAWSLNLFNVSLSGGPPPGGGAIAAAYTYPATFVVDSSSVRLRPSISYVSGASNIDTSSNSSGLMDPVSLSTRGISLSNIGPIVDISSFNSESYVTFGVSFVPPATPQILGGVDVNFNYAITGTWIIEFGYISAILSATNRSFAIPWTLVDDSTLPLMPTAIGSASFSPLPFNADIFYALVTS